MSDNNDKGDPPVLEPPANIVDQLLGSSAALQALGRELGPIIASAISTANSVSSNTHSVNTHRMYDSAVRRVVVVGQLIEINQAHQLGQQVY